MKRILLAVLVAGLLAATACAAPAEPAASTETPSAQPVFEEVARWSGVSGKTTAPFTVRKAPWAIVWVFHPDEPPVPGMHANLLQVTVRQVDDSLYMRLPVNIANVAGPTGDDSYIYDTGTFYLEISSWCGAWVVGVVTQK